MDGEKGPAVRRDKLCWFIFDWVVQDVFLCLVELARIVLMLSCVQVSFYFTSRSTKIMALSFTSKKESERGKQTQIILAILQAPKRNKLDVC